MKNAMNAASFKSLVSLISPTALVLGCLLSSVQFAEARPPIRKAFFAIYTDAVGTVLDTVPSNPGHCGVCHYDFNGGGPRNLYGSAIQAIYDTNGGDATAAILAVRAADSDLDGFSNDTEITNTATYANTPTFPGLSSTNVSLITGVTPSDVTPYLTPILAGDTTPPSITVITPNGGFLIGPEGLLVTKQGYPVGLCL